VEGWYSPREGFIGFVGLGMKVGLSLEGGRKKREMGAKSVHEVGTRKEDETDENVRLRDWESHS